MLATLGASQSLFANTLNAGETVSSPNITDFTTSISQYWTTNALASGVLSYSDGNGDFGDLLQAVYTDHSTGNLDFMFQFINTSQSAPSPNLASMTSANYANFTTDVGQISDPTYLPNSGLAFPWLSQAGDLSSVSRTSGSGNALTFAFSPTIDATSNTTIMVIRTNATSYDSNGSATFTFGADPAGLPGVYEPISSTSVPEPSTIVLLGVGLFGLALAGSLKRKGACASSISA